MKRIHLLPLLILTAIILASCGGKKDILRYNSVAEDIDTTLFDMRAVPASCFTFNAAPTGRPIENSTGKTVQVFQNAFWISAEPVSYEHWTSVMGKEPLSYENIERFLDKLYVKTHIPYIVPSEAMIEAALNHRAIDIDKPIFTSDDWTDTVLPDELTTDWRYISETGNDKTVRERYRRLHTESYRRGGIYRFHLAVRKAGPVPEEIFKQYIPSEKPDRNTVVLDGKKTYTAKGISFTMIPVEGGTAKVGATPEQLKYADEDEKPEHEISFRDFYIGENEVTVGLWNAVMGYLPSWNDIRYPDKPVVGVSWFDTKEFIQRLNAITDETFRLPDEYEWEYAARGGKKTHGYILSGSNKAKDVAVHTADDRGSHISNVRSKRPNELGLYDMSGNVWEWVQGTHSDEDGNCVLRGGSYSSRSAACRVSNRQAMRPGNTKDTFGFRLAQ